ncbi:DUF389 domain-containing protein [Streptomyces sp. NPDC048506]|uniref:DUF389 domain-containing protein n=1 Tax=Streptomyces sp. NPDC048506 TaxID=3155028 RepID=UPI00343756D8
MTAGRKRALRSSARTGSIAVDGVETMFSRRTEQIEADQPGALVHPPLWAAVEAHIRTEGTYVPSFYLFLAIAGLIGAVGIMTNSQILIAAAMVVGPEYNAITSIALGLDRGNRRRVRDGVRALTVGFLLAIAVTLGFAALARGAHHVVVLVVVGVLTLRLQRRLWRRATRGAASGPQR